MGFGMLFVGYFFANMMPHGSMLMAAKLIGYPLMIYAFYKLAPFHKRFLYCFYASFATLPFAVYFGLFGLSELGVLTKYWFLSNAGRFYVTVDVAYLTVSLVLHLLLLWAVSGLAKELQFQNILTFAYRNFTFVGVYFALRYALMLPFEKAQYLIGPTLILWLCMVFLNLFMLFKCYRFICPEGEDGGNDLQQLLSDKDAGRRRHAEEEDDGE